MFVVCLAVLKKCVCCVFSCSEEMCKCECVSCSEEMLYVFGRSEKMQERPFCATGRCERLLGGEWWSYIMFCRSEKMQERPFVQMSVRGCERRGVAPNAECT